MIGCIYLSENFMLNFLLIIESQEIPVPTNRNILGLSNFVFYVLAFVIKSYSAER